MSQNFLTSSAVINRIISLSTIGKTDHVVEIGAGKGHITKKLSENSGRVSAIEYDRDLYNKLVAKLGSINNVKLIYFDFLKWNLPNSSYKIFANIPFNRTTDIIRKIIQSPNPPDEAWLVVEKGAAKRFAGKPFESVISLMIKPRFDIDIAYHFRREDFHPSPSVDTVLLHLKRKELPDIDPCKMPAYTRFITDCLSNKFAGISKYLTKKQMSTALRLAHLSSDITSRETLYIQWLCLFRCYLQCSKK